MNRILAILSCVMILAACQPEGRMFTEHQELSPDLEWVKQDIPVFKVPVTDKNSAYDMKLTFRYANGYSYQVLLVKVTETSPSGKETVSEHELKIREDNGAYIGEAGYDIWDSEHLIAAKKSFDETGTYTYAVEHIMPVDKLDFAMEIGLVFDKSK